MDNNIGHKLDCEASTISNVNIGPTSINCLETIHNQLLFQLNHHVSFEHNPERFVLDDGMSQSTRLWVDRVVVAGVSDNIKSTVTASDGVSAKANATICETFAILLPIGVATPAVINRIAGSTREETELPPRSSIADTPDQVNCFNC